MEVIVGISGATSIASLLVALFKLGWPAVPSKVLAGVAILAGQISAMLTTMASGGIHRSQMAIATMIITGIIASAAAAGINRTDQKAEDARRAGGMGSGGG